MSSSPNCASSTIATHHAFLSQSNRFLSLEIFSGEERTTLPHSNRTGIEVQVHKLTVAPVGRCVVFSYRFAEVWGGTDAQSLEIVEPFFDSPYFKDMPLVPGAVEGVKALKSSGYELVVVTSRQLFLEAATTRWVHENFDNCFSKIVFGNHWGTYVDCCTAHSSLSS